MWRSWAWSVLFLVASCSSTVTATPIPSTPIVETAGPGIYRVPDDRPMLCDTISYAALKDLQGEPNGKPEITKTGSDPATVSGVRCAQQLDGGLISTHISFWTKVETARSQYDHHRDDVDKEEGKMTERPGIGTQAYALEHKLGGPTSPILQMQVQDSNAFLKLRLITDKPTEYTPDEINALFDAMGAFAKDVLAELPKA
ncbi:hypothetical protein [Alloactinosynnema sp. L-07]|nr:hypothetical protein [Alloactinosynnema sp. L-07]